MSKSPDEKNRDDYKDDPLRIITWRELKRIVPYSRQHIGRLEKQGKFPKHIKLGVSRVGWLKRNIETWLSERATLSGTILPSGQLDTPFSLSNTPSASAGSPEESRVEK